MVFVFCIRIQSGASVTRRPEGLFTWRRVKLCFFLVTAVDRVVGHSRACACRGKENGLACDGGKTEGNRNNYRTLVTHLWQISPRPSRGWLVPPDDSPWVMNSKTGLCLIISRSSSSKLNTSPGADANLTTSMS